MAPTLELTPQMASLFVEFIDDLYAEQAAEVEERLAQFYAASRLDGVHALACLIDAPEEVIATFKRAQNRYEALMEGAPDAEACEAKRQHAQVLLAVKARRHGHAH